MKIRAVDGVGYPPAKRKRKVSVAKRFLMTFFVISYFAILAFLHNFSIAKQLDVDLLPSKESEVYKAEQESDIELTIIVLGCNRPDGMLRALNSIQNANKIPLGTALHICVDGCRVPDVERVANTFEWVFGPKVITLRPHRLGLAQHITNCWENPLPGQWGLFVEDDVIISPHAFSAFVEARSIRARHEHSSKVAGIALHDSRVNQYCWKERVRSMACPAIQRSCNLSSATNSALGSLTCLESPTNGSWILNQIPSSWGAFYEGEHWSIFQQYVASRAGLTVGETLKLRIPHSYSNEWNNSWKRYFMELLYGAGWTVMYWVHPEQIGYATTLRAAGVHTTSTSEVEKKCLVNLPLFKASLYVQDSQVLVNGNDIDSYDYCSERTSVNQLVARGTACSNSLVSHYNSHEVLNSISQSNLSQALAVLHQANSMHKHLKSSQSSETWNVTSCDTTSLAKAEVIMATTCKALDTSCMKILDNLARFGGLVHVILAAPQKVCREFHRNVYASCVDEALFFFNIPGSPRLPGISNLLQAVRDAAPPTVKWLGVVNGDILFDGTLLTSLGNISKSELCGNHDSRCAITGQRTDVGWRSRRRKLHSEYGIDYFIFTPSAIDLVLKSNVLPPFTIGLIRWDNWLMYSLATNDKIYVIDASKALTALHFMNLKRPFLSKSNQHGVWNLRLAGQVFRLGRTDHANYRLDPEMGELVPLMDAMELIEKWRSKKSRFDFDEMVEKGSNYIYTSASMPVEYIRCFCDILTRLAQPHDPHAITIGKNCRYHSHLILNGDVNLQKQIIFKKEIFEIAMNFTLDDPFFRSTATWLTFKTNSTLNDLNKCCVFTQRSDLPTRVPDIFWKFDVKSMERRKCILN